MIRFQLSFLRQTRCFSTSIPALTATPSRTRKRVKKAAIISAPSDIDKPPVEPLKDEILPVITGGAKQLTVDDLDPSKIDTDPNRMEKMLSAKLMREYCVSKGLQKYGTKKVLISRIRKYWNVDTFDHIGKKGMFNHK